MTSNYKKKLIEVAIPLEAINTASAREKSIRHGHPSTLHLWWARRPLAACRAVLFAQLVDDPSSLPEQFPTPELQDAERKRLFTIIEDLVKWENSTNEEVLGRARAEIMRSCGGSLPPIYDPFSGGASIPLEAQRLGLPAYGSDLNPVAVMIGKAMIEFPARFKDQEPIHAGPKERNHYRNAEGLAEDVKYYGASMRSRAWQRIGHLYPQVDLPQKSGGRKATVVAWIWARTVPSPDPAFEDVDVPLVSSFTIRNTEGDEVWLSPTIDKKAKSYSLAIRTARDSMFDAALDSGTKTGSATFRCLISDAPISAKYINEMASIGRMGRRLLAVIAETKEGKIYVAGDETEWRANDERVQALTNTSEFQAKLPREKCRGTFASNAQGRRYGFELFSDYFIPRQQLVLATLASLIEGTYDEIKADAERLRASSKMDAASFDAWADSYARSICLYQAFAIDRLADAGSSMATWAADGFIRFTFARQGIAMTWDFAECNPFSDSTGNFSGAVEWISKALCGFAPNAPGHIVQANAESAPIPAGAVISMDPPYYSNISYADLSDYFYVWMKIAVGKYFPDQFSTIAVPKKEELIADKYRHGGEESARTFFLEGMSRALSSIQKREAHDSPTAIYYAFKKSEVGKEGMTSSGWITFLQAVLDAPYQVVRTWPVRTERSARTVALGNNALASSIVLVCRKRAADAETCTRAEFIRALKRELPLAIQELQAASIAPADMPQSAIGPGMGVFSRYRAVLESDDSRMSVEVALQLINRELDEYLGGIQGEFDADTRFAITWFEQHGMASGDYGSASNIATARGISVESVKHAGIIQSQAGKVRILKRDELSQNWDPTEDTHLTIWECLQYLVRQHEKDGIFIATALLLKKIGDKADAVKDLAYCLYDISANKRKDAKEATAYNALIADWTELSRQAAAIYDTRGDGQTRMDI